MSKNVLHSLLAVEGDLFGANQKIMEETKNVFLKKQDLFLGQHRRLAMFEDDGIDYPEEHKSIDTTVQKKLDHMQKTAVRYFDALVQKEASNQAANADLVVDGITIAENLPATFLLGMETRLKGLRAVYEAIPTLQPGIEWVEDPTQGPGVYKMAKPQEKLKTETIVEPVVLYEATPNHPAQVKESTKVKNVGKYIVNAWTSMISPAEKSEKLGRIDKLIRAVKKARQMANTTPVQDRTVGGEIFKYINGK